MDRVGVHLRWPFSLATACLSAVLCLALGAASAPGDESTVLGIEATHFQLKGQPAFLLGISYYAALGAPEDSIRSDLDDVQRYGFNWLRIWATWDMFDHDVSAVGADGGPREPYVEKLKWLVGECDRRGLVVDVTLARSAKRIADPNGSPYTGMPEADRAVRPAGSGASSGAVSPWVWALGADGGRFPYRPPGRDSRWGGGLVFPQRRPAGYAGQPSPPLVRHASQAVV